MADEKDDNTDQTSGGTSGTTGGSTSGSSGNNSGGTSDSSGNSSAEPVAASGTQTNNSGGGFQNSEEQKRELPVEAEKAAEKQVAKNELTPIEIAIRELNARTDLTQEEKDHAAAGITAQAAGVAGVSAAQIQQTVANVTGNHTPEIQQQAPLTPEERAKQQVLALLGGGGLSALISGGEHHEIPAQGQLAQSQAVNVAVDPLIAKLGGNGPSLT